MSDESDAAGENGGNGGNGEEGLDADSLRGRIEALLEELDEAETEADLDEIEAELETIEADLEATDLPEPDDEDAESPVDELESDLETVESELEEARGPYASDVVSAVDDAKTEIADTRWTEKGEASLIDAVDAFVSEVNDVLGESLTLSDDGDGVSARLTATLENAGATIEAADLDPDDDADVIDDLLTVTDDLQAAVDDAQAWDDLSVRQQLEAQGYYGVLDHVKDYPPELHALKVHRKRGNAEMVLLALETFDSDFMEEHALDALEIMAPEEAIDPMLGRAGKRDKRAISILGKIASDDEEILETLLDYVDADKDPLLQKVTFRALGEIGAGEAVQPLANKLVAENAEIRSAAARALGLIGDTRAIDPLADLLAEDEDDAARASAAWALNSIGTATAVDAAAEYTDDRSYLVQNEAEKARDAFEAGEAEPAA